MERTLLLSTLLLTISNTGSVDLHDKRVFNPAFYINTNPVVSARGVDDPNAARTDWLSTGLAAGLQGCGNFHAKQYLERYPDLKKKFGDNYTAAVEHFLTEGSSQGLLGYVEGGYEGRWTISQGQQDGLFISASSRMGGAVDSVVFDNTEFINAWDHGRELQLAMTFHPNGECFNPTEAGGRDDNRTATTKSRLLSMFAQGGSLGSKVLPAFWLRPGDAEGGDTKDANCHKGSKAINTVDTYDYVFAKNVTLGCPGAGDDSCFTFNSTVTVAGSLPKYDYVRVEGPTGYHTGEFNISKSLDVLTGKLVDYNSSLPLVFSTWCLQHAFGIWAPPGQQADYPVEYGVYHYLEAFRSFADRTNKWNVVWKKNLLPPNTGPWGLRYTVFVCVGTLVEAAECLMKLVVYHSQH